MSSRHGGEARLGGGAGGGEFVLQPLRQGFWPVEAEDIAAGRVGFKEIGEAGLDAGGLIEKWQRPARGREGLGSTLAVLLGLDFDANESRAFFFGLDDPDGLAVGKEQIVGLAKAVTEGKFADGNAAAGVDVGVGAVLDEPPSSDKHAVDGLAGLFFRRQSGLKALGHQCMTA